MRITSSLSMSISFQYVAIPSARNFCLRLSARQSHSASVPILLGRSIVFFAHRSLNITVTVGDVSSFVLEPRHQYKKQKPLPAVAIHGPENIVLIFFYKLAKAFFLSRWDARKIGRSTGILKRLENPVRKRTFHLVRMGQVKDMRPLGLGHRGHFLQKF
jgi:hypothetical protein